MSTLVRHDNGVYEAVPSLLDRIIFRVLGAWPEQHVEDRIHAADLNVLGSTFRDDYGQKIVNVHSPVLCEGRPCVIHNPSDHGMRGMKLRWRQAGPFDVKPSHFERICEHGVGHPDPDDLAYWMANDADYMTVHGCDGCC